MTILSATINSRRRIFEVETPSRSYPYPFSKCDPIPTSADPIIEVFVDPELGNQGFTYRLRSGAEGSILLDQVLDYNKDPSYLRDMLLYQLTVEAQKRIEDSPLSKREIIRRMGTSASQLYRLLDQSNYSKSVDQVLRLLNVLDCQVEFVVHAKSA
ncbi:MAG: hypothetical protein RBU45_20975 [Myxococcota bacterium]|jgi:hypothetical protein|nr:hypothetical protein [Myxococcota bacterium]